MLHCNGDLAEMTAVAGAAPLLSGMAAKRANAALDARGTREEFDVDAARKTFNQMIASERLVAQRMMGS